MAFADTARLAVQLDLKGNFTGNLRATQKALGDFDRSVASTGSRAYKAGTQIGTGLKNSAYIAAGAIGFLASNVALGLRALTDLESITTQTNAVLKSTKGVAGQTATSVRNLAEQYESLNATIDDKVIQSGENLLLTFTNIRKDAFEPALKAALDMNTALGRGESGLQGTIQQLGVALNDPIKGLTRLQRAGITFTKAQKDQITAAVAANDTFKAQGIILAELNKRYGGSFIAGGSTTTARIAKFRDAIEDLQKTLAAALLPTLGKVADALSNFLRDPAVVRGASELGDSIASMFNAENLRAAGDILKSVFLTAKAAAPIVVESAKAMAGIISTAVGVFRSLPPEIQKLAIGAFAINKITGGLVTNLAGGLISSVLKQLVSGVVNVQGAVVNVAGGAGGVAGAVGGGASKIGKAAAAIGKVFLVGAAAGAFLELKNILNEQTDRNKAQASALGSQTDAFAKSASVQDMKNSLAGIEAYTARLQAGQGDLLTSITYTANIDGVRDAIDQQKRTLTAAIRNAEAQSATAQVRATDRAEAIAAQKADAVRHATLMAARAAQQTEAAENRTTNAVRVAKERIAGAAKLGGAIAAAAIKAKDLSVNVKVPVTNIVRVSGRDVAASQKTISKYFSVAS